MKNIFIIMTVIAYPLMASIPYGELEDQATLPLLTPFFEKQQTAKIKLFNGLEAFLISNPELDESGAALVVDTGSLEDPKEFPGLAHFVEHMLFLGTEKYPKESEFQKFVTSHGGLTNAFTTLSHTSYIFTVNNSAFLEGLDRFASFFIAPLFNPSGLQREMQAVDQEFQMNRSRDQVRHALVQKELADPEHPYQHYHIGSIETLKNVSREAIIEWYKTHYSADKMHLIVYSTLPINELKTEVVNAFTPIANREVVSYKPTLRATSPKFDQHYIFIEPIQNQRTLTLIWELDPKFSKMKEAKPDHMICHVLGHESKGSLLSLLKKRGLATGLSCGSYQLNPETLQLMIGIELTKKGFQEKERVVELCFEAIALLKNTPYPERLFKEVQQFAKLNYQFQPRDETFSMLMNHAMMVGGANFLTYPDEVYVPTKFDPKNINELANYLTPETVRIDILAPKTLTKIDYHNKERWMDIPYAIVPIDQEWMTKWQNVTLNPEIHLPEPNPFLPKKLTRVEPEKPTFAGPFPLPTTAFKSPYGEIYTTQDPFFHSPKIYWTVRLLSPNINPTQAESIVITEMFAQLIKESLSEISYQAGKAELNFSLEREEDALLIKIEGLSENAKKLLTLIIQAIKNPSFTEENFQPIKEKLLRKYQNFSKEGSIQKAAEIMKQVIYFSYVTEKQKASALKRLTYLQFKEKIKELFQQYYFQAVLTGNQKSSTGIELGHFLKESFQANPFPKKMHYERKVTSLPEHGGPFVLQAKGKSQGNAIILAIENNPFTFKKRAALQILMHAIHDPFFQKLRTEQQTGYIVISYDQEIEKKLFSFFAVQSNTHTPEDLLMRFELFIKTFLSQLTTEEVTPEKFNLFKRTLIQKLEEPPKNLEQLAKLTLELLIHYEGDFHWIQKRLAGMKELTYEEFLNDAHEILGEKNKQRVAVEYYGLVDQNHGVQYNKVSNVKKLKNISRS